MFDHISTALSLFWSQTIPLYRWLISSKPRITGSSEFPQDFGFFFAVADPHPVKAGIHRIVGEPWTVEHWFDNRITRDKGQAIELWAQPLVCCFVSMLDHCRDPIMDRMTSDTPVCSDCFFWSNSSLRLCLCSKTDWTSWTQPSSPRTLTSKSWSRSYRP